MALEFYDILSRIGAGGRVKNCYAFVDRVAVSISKHRVGCDSWWRALAQDPLGNGRSIGAGYPYDPNTTSTRRCSDRANGLGQACPEEPKDPAAVPYFLVA